MSDPILGDAVGDTLIRILADAMHTDTIEAWNNAAEQVWGVTRLIMTMQHGSRWGTHYVIALGNYQQWCWRMADVLKRKEGHALEAEPDHTHQTPV